MIKLTADEQAHVRTALRYLRRRGGGWKASAPALGFRKKTLTNVVEGRVVSLAMAFSVARLAGVSVDDLLAGAGSRRLGRARTAGGRLPRSVCRVVHNPLKRKESFLARQPDVSTC